MPVITSIKPQKSKSRVNIYLDDVFGFGLDLENYLKLELKVGQELSEDRIIEITKKAEFQKVMDRLLNFTTIRPRSEKEVGDWMIRKKVDESLKKGLTEKLRKLDLLNDEKFAGWWIEQRLAFKNKSVRDLNYELRGKGIAKETINKVLGEGGIDEEKSAKELMAKKGYKWKGLGKIDQKRKMTEFLARRGFGWNTIKKVLEESI